ncbi:MULTISPECIES: cyclase family protein [Rhodococcus]|uniref:cyclase family protein n=1 Tax=Rhodococcus TaxID=1827 RepID=UPI000743ED98|nr:MULTISPECIES: cyclase family protein [Rhodococcus]AUM16426.1 metal-dependent hydrolase [Rhodococcus ruber]AWG97890.1 cyclase family protein [Rhodococcus ruber]MBD8052273.1 cyclase family protein [Rhodococcus ruber]MDO1477771.1 cyclase family protein [Rhodococcus ruber]
MSDAPSMRELLGDDAPSNWGRWGADDEIGALNFLGTKEVLSGIAEVESGDVFTLQIHMGRKEAPGDPLWPSRSGIDRRNTLDESSWDGEDAPQFPGGLHYADDTATLFLQGSTQYDALGHVWYDGKLWNGYDARSTVGSMDKASVLPIAEKGVVGRGILIDMARHRGKEWLDAGETFDHNDLEAAAAAQGVTIEPRDILVIRTGWLKYWYSLEDTTEFYADFCEPGLTYSRGLVEWFRNREIPNLVTDTIANEVTTDPASGVALPLHCALMRNLGVALTEIAWLEDLADACAADNRWTFLYTAAPLKVVGGTGAPVNPVVIR